MQVALSPEHEQRVDQKVRQGEYQSADEVVGTALRLMQEQDELLALRRDEIEIKIAAAEKPLKEGQGDRMRRSVPPVEGAARTLPGGKQ